jgi:hypothetical protein
MERNMSADQLTGTPVKHAPPQYSRSIAYVGVVAEKGKMIELRAPDPHAGSGSWSRMLIGEQAAEKLIEWLPEALAFARGEGT